MGASGSKQFEALPVVGKTILITGANSGIGFCAARTLAQMGANVVITARDKKRGEDALAKLRVDAPAANLTLELFDLSSFASIREFAARWSERSDPTLDILILNAGIMALPKRELSADGFEMQMQSNHLGHFLLTGLLLPHIQLSKAPRIIATSSVIAKEGKVTDPVDFVKERSYDPVTTYSESKLLNLLFTHELAKRYPNILCVTAHPGVSATPLFKHKWGWAKPFMQDPSVGAQATVRAAVDKDAQSGWYFGARGNSGAPEANIPKPALATNDAVALRYWQASEVATGIKY